MRVVTAVQQHSGVGARARIVPGRTAVVGKQPAGQEGGEKPHRGVEK